MKTLDFIILSLATWRMSNLLVNEDGPWLMFEHLRLRAGLLPPQYPDTLRDTDPPGKMPGALFACVWCMSVWVAGFFASLYGLHKKVARRLLLPLAISAIACMIDRWGNR